MFQVRYSTRSLFFNQNSALCNTNLLRVYLSEANVYYYLVADKPKTMNRLKLETSPYLLQHADNPVEWYPWGKAAFRRAEEEDKPILLSIGYSSCHWCHVMAHESFENEEIADFMNTHYVNIKVDREEHPDIDAIYMQALQLLTGSGGWPLNIFLTPQLKPFYGGTYFPPEGRGGMPSWMDVLSHIAHLYQHNRRQVENVADKLTEAMDKSQQPELPEDYRLEAKTEYAVDKVPELFQKRADSQFGGFGHAPKFPSIADLHFLLDASVLHKSQWAGQHLIKTVDHIIRGGIYDHIGGGITRYSTTRDWRVPHFEKMLYDNALLIELLANVTMSCLDRRFEYEMADITAWIEREMSDGEGGFYSAMDADSEGQEGRYYIWDKGEMEEILGEEAEAFMHLYNITDEGNWEGKNIPEVDPDTSYQSLMEQRIQTQAARQKILSHRTKTRVLPGIDRKILADWNALLVSAWCRAYRATGEKRYLKLALSTISYLKKHFIRPDYSVLHIHGDVPIAGNLDDYAFVIRAAYELFVITQDKSWVELGERILSRAQVEFYDQDKGVFFFSSKNREDTIIRKIIWQDVPVPSGFAVITEMMYVYGAITGREEWRITSEEIIQRATMRIIHQPMGHGQWLSNIMYFTGGHTEMVLLGEHYRNAYGRLLRAYIPGSILAGAQEQTNDLPILKDKTVHWKTTIYICKGKSCMPPVDGLDKLKQEISGLNCQ